MPTSIPKVYLTFDEFSANKKCIILQILRQNLNPDLIIGKEVFPNCDSFKPEARVIPPGISSAIVHSTLLTIITHTSTHPGRRHAT